jgi:DNA-binding CsgD family transcriptional regulator
MKTSKPIRTVAAGERHLAPGITRKLAEGDLHPLLSPGGTEMLHLIASGLANKQIASELMIREPTVKSQVAHIPDKLEVPDRTCAITLAVVRGLPDLSIQRHPDRRPRRAGGIRFLENPRARHHPRFHRQMHRKGRLDLLPRRQHTVIDPLTDQCKLNGAPVDYSKFPLLSTPGVTQPTGGPLTITSGSRSRTWDFKTWTILDQ